MAQLQGPESAEALVARSRKLMQTQGFAVHKMAQSSAMETSPECHEYMEILIVLEGNPRFRIGTRLYHARPGALLIFAPGQTHQMIFSGESSSYERIVVNMAPEYARKIINSMAHRGYHYDQMEQAELQGWVLTLPPELQNYVVSSMMVLVQEQLHPDAMTEGLAEDLWRSFFAALVRAAGLEQGRPDEGENTAISSLSVSLLQYIEDHYAEDFAIADVARLFYTSKNNLMATFRRDIGTSIYSYLLQRRAEEARRLLLEGVAPTEIALRCGFRDYSNFYRVFCSVYGCGPREYLKQESH